jgi:NADH-quinone oxidoreductase subunit H
VSLIGLQTTLDLSPFFNDRWWVVLLKALFAFVILLLLTLFTIWFERRVVAFMQHRIGPTMNGPFGLLQSLADGMKLMFKEDFTPKAADKLVFMLAPFVVSIPAITAFAVIPIAGEVRVPFSEIKTPLQVTDLPVSVLFVVAVASIGVYGIVLAGWSSGSTYALLGALRSSAQVISYEVAMGLALVAVFLYAGSLSTSEIVAKQAVTNMIAIGGVQIPLPSWYCVVLLPSFVIYLISMVGETNRAPFDLPEAEGELVGGFHTEYSSMRFAMFFMAEYMNMITVSALATTLFLGGWHAPLPFNLLPGADRGYWGVLWFVVKVLIMLFIFVWLRGTLPRLRYDQFMRFGWRWLIPISLVWIVLVATFNLGRQQGWFSTGTFWIIAVVIFAVLLGLSFFGGGKEPEKEEAESRPEAFDAFAGGYPVPPMPGQVLPELAGVLTGATEDDPYTPGGLGGVVPPGVNTAPPQSPPAASPGEGKPTSTGAET